MENNTNLCPSCGSSKIHRGTCNDTVDCAGCEAISFEVVNYTCEDCQAEGDFFNENDKIVEEKTANIRKNAVARIVGNLNERGYTISTIERNLGLPPRTINKWKNVVNPSASAFTLLQLVNTLPWLLKVAENDFNCLFANRIASKESSDYLSQYFFQFKENQTWKATTTNDNKVSSNVTYQISSNYDREDLDKKNQIDYSSVLRPTG